MSVVLSTADLTNYCNEISQLIHHINNQINNLNSCPINDILLLQSSIRSDFNQYNQLIQQLYSYDSLSSNNHNLSLLIDQQQQSLHKLHKKFKTIVLSSNARRQQSIRADLLTRAHNQPNDAVTTSKLYHSSGLRAKQLLLTELDKSSYAIDALQRSTGVLVDGDVGLSNVDNNTIRANKILNIKQRREKIQMIYFACACALFITVVMYIIIKRIQPLISIVLTIASTAISPIKYIVSVYQTNNKIDTTYHTSQHTRHDVDQLIAPINSTLSNMIVSHNAVTTINQTNTTNSINIGHSDL